MQYLEIDGRRKEIFAKLIIRRVEAALRDYRLGIDIARTTKHHHSH